MTGEVVPVGAPSPARCPLPGRRTTSGISRTGQLPRAWNALPGGAGEPSGVPRAGEAEPWERSPGTHLPGRHRARVPGGRSAGMARAPPRPPRRRAGTNRRASPPLRSFPSAAPGRGQRGGAGPSRQRHLPGPGNALFAACVPEVRGGAEGKAFDVAPTLSVLDPSAPGRTFLGPEEALGRQRRRLLPPPHSHARGSG